MDFLSLFPYIGIIILVVLNAILVIKRDIIVEDTDRQPDH